MGNFWPHYLKWNCLIQLYTPYTVVSKFLFYRAMLRMRGTRHGPVSVCLTVSVTSRCSTNTAKRRITQTTPVVSALLLRNWQDFNWHDASRGPSAIAELLVSYDKGRRRTTSSRWDILVDDVRLPRCAGNRRPASRRRRRSRGRTELGRDRWQRGASRDGPARLRPWPLGGSAGPSSGVAPPARPPSAWDWTNPPALTTSTCVIKR